eukprot:m.40229 g.40229  ORF g.40229 m.40229 type:complete len:376 (+) comp16724_c0_seq2:551-1678(+)
MLLAFSIMAGAQLLLGVTHPEFPPVRHQINCTAVLKGHISRNQHAFETHGELWEIIVLFAIAKCGWQFLVIAYHGLVADRTPLPQRAQSSGSMGFLLTIGAILGASIGTRSGTLGVVGLAILSVAILALVLIANILSQPERTQNEKVAQPMSLTAMMLSLLEPLRESDFRKVFFFRSFVELGLNSCFVYTPFFLADVVPLPDGVRPENAASYFLIPSFITSGVASVFCGYYSHKLGGQRRMFMLWAVILLSLGAVSKMLIRSFYWLMVGELVFALGVGTFISIDFALIMDVLPNEEDRARDIATTQLATLIPQVLAYAVGGLIRDEFSRIQCPNYATDVHCSKKTCDLGYIILFLFALCMFLVSIIFVRGIRKAK